MTRSKDSSPRVCCRVSIPGRNERLWGAGSAQAGTQVLPAWRRMWARPSAEPMQSPSGCSCASRAMRCAGCMRAIACWTRLGSSCAFREQAFSLIGSTIHCLLIFELANQFEDARTLFDRCIQFKNQFRHITQHDATSEFVAQKASGVFQRLNGGGLFLLGSQDADKDLGVAQVAADLYVFDAGEAHARVFCARAQQVAWFNRDQFTEFLLPVWLCHPSISFCPHRPVVQHVTPHLLPLAP